MTTTLTDSASDLGQFSQDREWEGQQFRWNENRVKRIILEIYDAIADSKRTGRPYQTRLDPPPADPRWFHPPGEGGRS